MATDLVITPSGICKTMCIIGLCSLAIPSLVMSAYAVSRLNSGSAHSPVSAQRCSIGNETFDADCKNMTCPIGTRPILKKYNDDGPLCGCYTKEYCNVSFGPSPKQLNDTNATWIRPIFSQCAGGKYFDYKYDSCDTGAVCEQQYGNDFYFQCVNKTNSLPCSIGNTTSGQCVWSQCVSAPDADCTNTICPTHCDKPPSPSPSPPLLPPPPSHPPHHYCGSTSSLQQCCESNPQNTPASTWSSYPGKALLTHSFRPNDDIFDVNSKM